MPRKGSAMVAAIDDHLSMMRNCRWSVRDGTGWRCVHPMALAEIADPDTEFVDCWCLNPAVVPCPNWEPAQPSGDGDAEEGTPE